MPKSQEPSIPEAAAQLGSEPPTTTVVIPAFNHELFIAQTLESVLCQTRLPKEVIVVNDGSPDNTDMAVAPYLDRVTYVRQANTGVSGALNRGIGMASGDYLLFLASDDWLAPNAIELTAEVMDSHPEVGLVHAAVTRVDAHGNILSQARDWRAPFGKHAEVASLIRGNYVPAMGALVRAQAIRNAGPFTRVPVCPGLGDVDSDRPSGLAVLRPRGAGCLLPAPCDEHKLLISRTEGGGGRDQNAPLPPKVLPCSLSGVAAGFRSVHWGPDSNPSLGCSSGRRLQNGSRAVRHSASNSGTKGQYHRLA